MAAAVGLAVGAGVGVATGRVWVIGVSGALQNVRPARAGTAWLVANVASKPLKDPSAFCWLSKNVTGDGPGRMYCGMFTSSPAAISAWRANAVELAFEAIGS